MHKTEQSTQKTDKILPKMPTFRENSKEKAISGRFCRVQNQNMAAKQTFENS